MIDWTENSWCVKVNVGGSYILLGRGGIRGNLKLVLYIRAVQAGCTGETKMENTFVKKLRIASSKESLLSFGRLLFES